MPLQRLKNYLSLIERVIEFEGSYENKNNELILYLEDKRNTIIKQVKVAETLGTEDETLLQPLIESIDDLREEFIRYLCLLYNVSSTDLLIKLYA